MAKSTRVMEMQKNFMQLRSEGKSIAEIASMFNITTKSVYDSLQEIANKNRVPRKDLLDRDYPETRMPPSTKKSSPQRETIDFPSYSKETITLLDDEIKKLEKFLKEI